MKIAIVPVKVTEISVITQEFNVADVIGGILLKTQEGKFKVLIEAEYHLGVFNSFEAAFDAITDIYILLADIETRHCIDQMKSCLKKFIGIDLSYII